MDTLETTLGEFRKLSKQEQDQFEIYDESLDKWVNFSGSKYEYEGQIGFSTVRDPYAPINAITVYIPDREKYFTLAIPPKWYLDLHGTDTAPLLQYGEALPDFAEIGFFATEKELLTQFLNLIEDLDVISGWNSDFFDIPYIIQRVKRVLGNHHAKRMCFDGCQEPQEREIEHFGSLELTYVLSGRVHLDYLNLFKKFTFGGRESYSLAAIAEEELDIPKLHYDGTLANLYTDDFVTFLHYNIRDVEILHRLDEKYKFIQLANTMAHESTVMIPAVFGSVQYIDTAIVNYAHNVLNRIVSDKTHKPTIPVEGALVVTPQVGMHENIFSVDINSLYPNTYRTLNLSPECIVGQFTNFEADWRGIRASDIHDHILEFDDPARFGLDSETLSTSGEIWQSILREKSWSITAYGTVIDQSKGPGVIPRLLGDWYADRKKKQKLSKEHQANAKEWLNNGGSKTDQQYIDEITLYEYYDLLQYTKKISLNSLYGATLNEFCRFHDPRLGASTTGSGRQITTHMIQTLSKLITGVDYKLVKEKKADGGADYVIPYESHVLYGDTDSVHGSSIIYVNESPIKIEDFFNVAGGDYEARGEDNYVKHLKKPYYTFGVDEHGNMVNKKILYAMAHKVKKRMFRIKMDDTYVDVTEDHSVMIKRDGKIISVKTADILKSDKLIKM